MKLAGDQAEFYILLTRLLWFLGSGKAHVGYLCNTQRNSFVAKEVRNPFICVFVSRMSWICPDFGLLFFLTLFPNNSCYRNDLFLLRLRLYSVALNFCLYIANYSHVLGSSYNATLTFPLTLTEKALWNQMILQ